MDGTTASLIVIGVRLLVPLTILRWPLLGLLASIIADTYDWTLFGQFGFGLFGDGQYQLLDKLLDTWYLTLAFVVTRRWMDPLVRRTAAILFSWRMFGVLAFALTGTFRILVFAPNVFEFFYIAWLVAQKFFPFRLTPRRLGLLLLIASVPKLFQEIHLHW